MGDYYTERRGVRASETVIDRKELAALTRRARAGAAYEAAARLMRSHHAEVLERFVRTPNEHDRGWLAAIREFSDKVVSEGRHIE